MEAPLGTLTTYTYTALDQRRSAETEDATTKFLWDAQNILQEYDDLDATQAAYTLAPQPEPQPYGDLLSQHRDAESTFYHADALGSTRVLTDESEVVTDEAAYEAFGQVAFSTGTTANPFQWIGQKGIYTQEDERRWMRAREYDAGQGRFLSEDPLGFDGGDGNLYRYAGNEPISNEDPGGERQGKALLKPQASGNQSSPQRSPSNRFPERLVQQLVTEGLAFYYQGSDKQFAIVIDATGSEFSALVLQYRRGSVRMSRSSGYELVLRRHLGDVELAAQQKMSVADFVKDLQTQQVADRHVERYLVHTEAQRQQFWANAAEFGYHMIPLAAALDSSMQGKYGEATLALAGDAAFFLTGGLAAGAKVAGAPGRAVGRAAVGATARSFGETAGTRLGGVLFQNVQLGGKARRAGLVLESGLGVTRATQGVFALRDGETGEAYGYFGEAFLRLVGVSAGALSKYKEAGQQAAKLKEEAETIARQAALKSAPIGASPRVPVSPTPLDLVQSAARQEPVPTRINLGHILDGEVRPVTHGGTVVGQRAVGGHYARSPNVRVTEIVQQADRNGVTVARVEIRDPATGRWIPKRADTSLYPSHWSRRQVQLEVEAAFRNSNPVTAELWEGISPSGVRIQGYYTRPDGGAATAWPVYGN